MMNLKLNLDRIATPTTWILRIFTGGVFLYSGFVKAIDAWGTFYKFGDYLSVMHLDVWAKLGRRGRRPDGRDAPSYALDSCQGPCG